MTDNLFTEIRPSEIKGNPFQMIDKEWFLITAGNLDNFNTMTASWGSLGILWNKPVVFCFVRPQRYTYQFMEKSESFSLCFFGKEFRSELNFCGKYSGRDIDKIEYTGFKPLEAQNGSVFFEQAHLVLECKKLYFSDIDPSHFLDPTIQKNYPINDYHRMYIGEIQKCMVKS